MISQNFESLLNKTASLGSTCIDSHCISIARAQALLQDCYNAEYILQLLLLGMAMLYILTCFFLEKRTSKINKDRNLRLPIYHKDGKLWSTEEIEQIRLFVQEKFP